MTTSAYQVNLGASPDEIWEKCLESLVSGGHSYPASQLAQLTPAAVVGDALVVHVTDRFFRDWVDDHYRALVEECVKTFSNVAKRVSFIVPEGIKSLPTKDERRVTVQRAASGIALNPRFTFDSYVVADSNQLPAAAAMAVADAPGRAYNPLFVYGGTGLGKTHLLHAIGNRIRANNPDARIVYLSTEEFTNQFIESVREHRMPDFRRRFRDECDALLIDDIQFLGKKQETQNEFFYTFNTLHSLGKAIVLTSDTTPSEIPGLEDRLRSRFSMGLTTDVQEPNFELRVAILRKRAMQEGLQLPDRVSQFIARHVQSNVRELEGALVKVAAVHSLTGQPLTEAFVTQVLKDILPAKRELGLDEIVRETAKYYRLNTDDVKGERRTKHLVHARHVAMYLARKLTTASLPEIGLLFGKDHTTVLASVRKIDGLVNNGDLVDSQLHEIQARLGIAPAA